MKGYQNRLVIKLIAYVVILLALALSVIISNYFHAINVVKDNLITAKAHNLDIYVNHMDNRLLSASGDLDAILAQSDQFDKIGSSDESTRYFASREVLELLNQRIFSNRHSDVLILYHEISETYLASHSTKISGADKWRLETYVRKTTIHNQKRSDPWRVMVIDQVPYFYKAYALTTTKLIAVVLPDTLMSFVDVGYEVSDSYWLHGLEDDRLAWRDYGQIMDSHSKGIERVYRPLNQGEASLWVGIKAHVIQNEFSFQQYWIFLLSSLFLLLIPYLAYKINQMIVRPIQNLTMGIEAIEAGNLDHQVIEDTHSEEFQGLIRTFNGMVKEIKNLKIQTYEEAIALQKSELKFLQSQLRPHFLLNAMTTIHNLTYQKDMGLVRTYIDALQTHFRYVLKGANHKVPIFEELNHVKNYIAMQEIRFPGSVFYAVDMENELSRAFIPQLMLLTIVENAFKYAMTLDETLSILIQIQTIVVAEVASIQVVIEDNGEGFEVGFIEKVNAYQNWDHTGKQIGIMNVKKTLALLYPEQSRFTLSNAKPSGAKIEMILPIEVEK